MTQGSEVCSQIPSDQFLTLLIRAQRDFRVPILLQQRDIWISCLTTARPTVTTAKGLPANKPRWGVFPMVKTSSSSSVHASVLTSVIFSTIDQEGSLEGGILGDLLENLGGENGRDLMLHIIQHSQLVLKPNETSFNKAILSYLARPARASYVCLISRVFLSVVIPISWIQQIPHNRL